MSDEAVRIKRVPEMGWAVFDNGRKVLPAEPNAWFATRKHATAALAATPLVAAPLEAGGV